MERKERGMGRRTEVGGRKVGRKEASVLWYGIHCVQSLPPLHIPLLYTSLVLIIMVNDLLVVHMGWIISASSDCSRYLSSLRVRFYQPEEERRRKRGREGGTERR